MLNLETLKNEVDDFTSRVELAYNKHLTIPKVAEKYHTLCMKEPSYKNSETFEDDKVRIDKIIRSAEESLNILKEELDTIKFKYLYRFRRRFFDIMNFIETPLKLLDNFQGIITETKSWFDEANDGHKCRHCREDNCYYKKYPDRRDRRCDCIDDKFVKDYTRYCGGRFCLDVLIYNEIAYSPYEDEDENLENCFINWYDYQCDFWYDDSI